MSQDLGSSPATMEAGNAADIFGSQPSYNVQQVDAEQAYVHAPMRGPNETWDYTPKTPVA